jgi:hypothetical protein
MLRNVRLLAPIVVLAMFSAIPVVPEMVLTIEVLFWVALTVPPPVALKPVPLVVVRFRPPAKLIVPPVLPVRLIAFAVVVVAVIVPAKVVVSPV